MSDDNVTSITAKAGDVPDATSTEAVIVGCPECDWTMTLPWPAVSAESGGTDQRAEYRAHYVIFHRGSENLGAIVPGTVIRVAERLLEQCDTAEVYQAFMDGLMAELRRAAGHSQFTVVVGDDLTVEPPIVVEPPAEARESST